MPSTSAEGRRSRTRRFWFLWFPLLVSLVAWGATWVFGSWTVAWQVLTVTVVSLLLGVVVIFGPAVMPGIDLETWQLAVLMSYTSAVVAWLCAWNLHVLERIPRLGPFLHQARDGARATLKEHRWIRRLAVFGVFLFVLLPMPGSGAVGGAIVAHLLGLAPLLAFATVTVASASVCAIYAASGIALKHWLDQEHIATWIRVSGAALVLLVAWLLVKLLRWFAAQAARE